MYVRLSSLITESLESRLKILKVLVDRCATGATVHKLQNLMGVLMMASDMGLDKDFEKWEKELRKVIRKTNCALARRL